MKKLTGDAHSSHGQCINLPPTFLFLPSIWSLLLAHFPFSHSHNLGARWQHIESLEANDQNTIWRLPRSHLPHLTQAYPHLLGAQRHPSN